MLLAKARKIWSRQGLNGPVLVNWGKFTGPVSDLTVAAGNTVYLFTTGNETTSGYTLAGSIDLSERVLSLAGGLVLGGLESVIAGLSDRLVVLGYRQGSLVKLMQTPVEAGAFFIDLAVDDLDGDGTDEIIAASEINEAIFVYQAAMTPGEADGLQLLAIRLLPGAAQKVVTFRSEAFGVPVIAVAYEVNNSSGLMTLIYTERGFAEGPQILDLGVKINSLAKGDFRPGPGEELAWGGRDGAFRILVVNNQLNTVLVSDNLGSTIPALTAGKLPGSDIDTLVAGTPGAFLFGYLSPVLNRSPDWALWVGRPVYDLAISEEGRLGLGSANGSVQVWELSY